MLVKLFDIQNNKVVPSEHCYTLKSLKTIMEKYPDTYLSVYQYESAQNTEKDIFNKYTKMDPTLPRLNTIRCPNDRCSTNTNDEAREVIYMRYDDKNMKYMYLCCKCDFKWKT